QGQANRDDVDQAGVVVHQGWSCAGSPRGPRVSLMAVSAVNKTLARIVPGLPYAGPVSSGGGARPHLPFAAGGAPGPGGRADRQPRGPPGKGKAPARDGAPSGGPAAALPAVADPAVHVAAVEAERRIQAVRDQARGGV